MNNLVSVLNPATNVNATLIQVPDRFGKPNAAYGLNITNVNIITIPPAIMNGRGTFTISLWVNMFMDNT